MSPQSFVSNGKSISRAKPSQESPNIKIYKALLAGHSALVPEQIDPVRYKKFCANVDKLMLKLSGLPSESAKADVVKSVRQVVETYHDCAEGEIQKPLSGWGELTAELVCRTLISIGKDPTSACFDELMHKIADVKTLDDLVEFKSVLEQFLPTRDSLDAANGLVIQEEEDDEDTPDASTANDNATGLRGGGSAVERLRYILNRSGKGYIVIFHISCLGVIQERFGVSAVQDCLMAVSAFLTEGLRSQDAVYHWGKASLLAILQGRVSEQALRRELNKILSRNRDVTVKIRGLPAILRIPLAVDVTPIAKLAAPEDLYKLPT